MLNSAGSETAKEKSNVRIPFADFTNLKTRPTRKTRTTRNKVGDTKKASIASASTTPEIEGERHFALHQ